MGAALTATASISSRPADLRALVPAVVAWGMGVWALVWPAPIRLLVGVVLVLVTLALLRRSVRRGDRGAVRKQALPPDHPHPGRTLGALTALVTALVLLVSAQAAWRDDVGPIAGLAADGSVATVTGRVLVEPIVIGGDDGRPIVTLTRMRLSSVEARGYRSDVSTPVLVRGNDQWVGLQWRQEVTFTAKVRPGERGRAERAVLVPVGEPEAASRDWAILRASDHVRASLRQAVDHLPTDARALVPALVIGDVTLTPDDLSDAMRETGMSHLSAVSGSNLAICVTAVMAVVIYTPVRARGRVVVGLVVIVAFIVIARPEPSVMRAALMGAVGVIAFSRGRAAAGLPALSGAMILLLVIDPWLARSYGFVLSTLATLGLILFARPWGAAILRVMPGGSRLPQWVGDALAIPVAAHVMTAPVVVLLQGHVSLIAIVANVLAAPLVAPATLAGAGTALAASFFPTVGAWIAWLAAPPAWLIARIGRWADTVPGGAIPWPEGAPGALLLAGIVATLIFAGPWMTWAVRSWPVLSAAAAALLLALFWPVQGVAWPPPDWRVSVCDVGQGDGILIATGERRAIVVDVGPEPDSMSDCLSRHRIRAVDAIILTHFHADHVGGLSGVVRRWPVNEIFVSPTTEPEESAAFVERLAREHSIPTHDLRAGDRLVWDDITAEVWWPARTIYAGSIPNNSSVVVAVHTSDLKALLLGDIEREAGRAILSELRRDPARQEFAADLDLVKTPHHGSANIHPGLLEALPSTLAVVSVGENDFGHPTQEHLDLFADTAQLVVRTDERGDIALLPPGEEGQTRWQASR